MKDLVIEKRVTSETLTIPELKDLIGQDVRIRVSVRHRNTSHRFDVVRAAVGKNLIDAEAIQRLREASRL